MSAGRNILIIDDDVAVASAYKEQFEQEGYSVEIATDGRAGFFRIQETHPTAVLLDLMLPELNGVEIIKKIRAQKRFHKMPIIALSNAFMVNLVSQAAEAGATKVFNKAAVLPRDIVAAFKTAAFPMLPAEFVPGPGESIRPSEEAPPKKKASAGAPAPSAFPALRMKAEESPADKRRKPVPPKSPVQNDTEQLQTELRANFVKAAQQILTSLRQSLQQLESPTAAQPPGPVLCEMFRAAHTLTGKAAITGHANVAHFSSAVAALLKELSRKPQNLNVSSMRTLLQAFDAMAQAVEQGQKARRWISSKVLVLDDDGICRETLRSALDLADLPSIIVGQPELALKLLAENYFDLIFLDVDMPGTNGFQVCEKVRALPGHQSSIIVFVTVLADVESRTRAAASGGSDFIAKPFLLVEMAVKALIYLAKLEPDLPDQSAQTEPPATEAPKQVAA